MKVDILVPVGEKGGVENIINMTVPFLQQRGMEVRVVQLVASGVIWTTEGIPYYSLLEGLAGHTMAEFIEVYAKFLQKHGAPDCILATSWPMMCYVARRVVNSINQKDIVIISWLHNPVEMYVASGFGGYDELSYADVHFAISVRIQDGLKEHFPDQMVEYVTNPVNFDKCVCASKVESVAHKKKKLYFVGRVDEQKRLDLIIQAVAASGDSWELYIIGDDDNAYGTKMKKLSKACGVKQRVHWLGWKNNPWSFVEQADAVVLASDFEGYPLTAIEAQANGLMVLATPVSGIEELITPGENGYLFPCGDWKALSDILFQLAKGQLSFADPEICRGRVAKFEKNVALEDFYDKLCNIMKQREAHKEPLPEHAGITGEREKGKMTRQQIYRTNVQLQMVTDQIIHACHIQNYDKVVRLFTELTTKLMQVLESVFLDMSFYNQQALVVSPEGVSASLEDMMSTQENQDYVLLADLLELQLLPFLQSLQEQIRNFEPVGVEESAWERNMQLLQQKDADLYKKLLQHHERYERDIAQGTWRGSHHLEDTNSGAFTLAGMDERGTYYYHSNVNPGKEAVEFARYYYQPGSDAYVIWGLGLGYHVLELWKLDSGITLSVYENDLDVIYHCLMTVDMSGCLQASGVHLVYDPQFTKITNALDKVTENVILHYPSLRHIPDLRIRKQMEMFFIRDSGKRNAAILFESNSRENFKNYDGYVDELHNHFKGKKVIIVAAGPSLDKNVELLKNKPEGTLILAVETVFRKLLALGIDVDYMIVTDANSRIYGHLAGLEQQQVPMLYLSTAWREYSENYAGRKYLICQDGYAPAELLAGEKGWNLYHTGGSVSTTALDVCIRLGCRSIAFIGLDLAYTGNKAHADGTARVEADGTEAMQQVPAIGGGTVAASRLFMMYNQWIAKRVTDADVTMPVYDATEGGAVIPGLQRITLKEYMEQERK